MTQHPDQILKDIIPNKEFEKYFPEISKHGCRDIE